MTNNTVVKETYSAPGVVVKTTCWSVNRTSKHPKGGGCIGNNFAEVEEARAFAIADAKKTKAISKGLSKAKSRWLSDTRDQEDSLRFKNMYGFSNKHYVIVMEHTQNVKPVVLPLE